MSPSPQDEIERLGRVFEKAPYPVFICDRRGELVYANSAATQLYSGLHKAPSIEQWTSIAKLREPETGRILPTDQYPIARALRGEVTSGKILEFYNFKTKSTYKVSIDAHPVYGSEGELLGAVAIHRVVKES